MYHDCFSFLQLFILDRTLVPLKIFKHIQSIDCSKDSLGEGNGNPLQYSCLENPMDRGAWWTTVHGVAKSWTLLSDFTSLISLTSYLSLEKEMATHSSILVWRIPWMEEPGRLQSIALQSQTQLKRLSVHTCEHCHSRSATTKVSAYTKLIFPNRLSSWKVQSIF